MSTGDKFLAIQPKRLLGYQDFGERFLDYLVARQDDFHERAFGIDGVFGGVPITISVHSGNLLQLDNDQAGTDNNGHMLETDAELSGRDVGLAFQNTGSVLYDLALHYAERPRGVQVNPRTAKPEFISWEETIGERADPDSVTDNGSTITFEVDAVVNPFSPSVIDGGGRKCLVWKIQPGESALTEAVAVELCIVVFGTNNEITTTGLLGQTTVSTTAADYQVLLLGPTIIRNAIQDLETTAAYEFIGQLLGGTPPASFDISSQNDLGSGFAIAMNQITRTDAHGDLKIRVNADASDVDEPQISVDDSGGSPVFDVDEDGDLTANGAGVIGGGLSLAGVAAGDLALLASFGKIDASALTTLKVSIKDSTGVFRVENASAQSRFTVNASGNASLPAGDLTLPAGSVLITGDDIPLAMTRNGGVDIIDRWLFFENADLAASTTETATTRVLSDLQGITYDIEVINWGKAPGDTRFGAFRIQATVKRVSGSATVVAMTTLAGHTTDSDVRVAVVASGGNIDVDVTNNNGSWAVEYNLHIRERLMTRT